MKTRCPSCGATNSLDTLVVLEDARQALLAAFNLSGALGQLLIKYCGLFRPTKTELTFKKMARLINELLPDINRGEITFDRINYPASEAIWIWAIDRILDARQTNHLKLPFDNHNYLYKVIISYKPEAFKQPNYSTPTAIASSITSQIGSVLKPVNQPQPTLKAFVGLNHSEKSAYLLQQKQSNETLEQCYQRLLHEQEQQGDTP